MKLKLKYFALAIGLIFSSCSSEDCCISGDRNNYALLVKSKVDSSDLLNPDHEQTLNTGSLKIYYLDDEDNREEVQYSIPSLESGEYFLNHMTDQDYALNARSIFVWGANYLDTIKLEMSYIFDDVKYLERVYFNGSKVWDADSVGRALGLSIVDDRIVTIYK